MLHQECRLLFVDMKPENVMLGLSGDNEPSSLRLIDFGLSRSYIGQGGAHKPLSQSGVEGTPDFLSLASHGGASPSRRDDLEASAYVLLSLMGRQLPWSNAKSDVEGCKLKGATDLAELCEGVAPLASWITMARSIPYEGRPDYAAFIKLLDELERAPGAGKMANTGTSSPAPKRVRKGSSAAAVSTKSSSPTRKRTSVSESAKRNAKVTAARTVEAPAKVCSNEGPAVAATEAQPARVPSAKKKRGRTLARTPQKEDARKSTGATPISAGDGPPACFSLVCCEGPHNGEIFPVPIAAMGASVTLGSSSDADIVLSGDKQLSRLHLELQLARGSSTLRVKDLGSLNGTKINDRAISKRSNGAIVNKDDVITLGRTQLTLVLC
jgi:serine/threonine protein kinase